MPFAFMVSPDDPLPEEMQAEAARIGDAAYSLGFAAKAFATDARSRPASDLGEVYVDMFRRLHDLVLRVRAFHERIEALANVPPALAEKQEASR